MRKLLLALLVSAYINQCLCAVTWNSPSDGDTETLAEDSVVGSIVVPLNATAANTVGYGIVSQTPNEDKFGLQNANELYLKEELDYETTKSYDVLLRALDNTAGEDSDITLTVTVTDVNDNTPVITSDTSTDLPTDSAVGSVVFTVTSTDEDTVGTVTYSITSGNDNQDFSINATTGEITLNNALNITTTEDYGIGIEATDGVNTVTQTIRFYVNDVIWQIPQDGQTDTLVENTTVDTTILTLDADNAGIYLIIAVDPEAEENKFKIEDGSALNLKEPLDYETTKSYTLILTALKTSSLTSVITYTINITDVNDEPPVFTSTANMDLTKDTEIGTVVYTAEVTDPDSVGSSTFSITGGNTNADFSIDTTTGDLTLDNALDPDVNPTYSLEIEATDSMFTSTMTLSVTVNRIAWTDPVSGASEDLPEDTAVNTVIKTLAADTATIYIITDQSPHLDVFGIDNTNELVLLTALDYENTTSYTISFRAIDASGRSADITYIVNVTDVNDLEPVFVSGTIEVIQENTPVGTTIHTASATDGDTVGTVTYSIKAGNDGGTFGIDSSTGEITLIEALNPNSTADLSYSLLIEATDSVHPVTQSLAVSVKSVPVVVLPADDTTSITENADTSGPYVVLILESTDLDNDPAPEYSIDSQSHPGTFSISDDNTQLITTASFDREQISEYNVTIRVTDTSEFDLSSASTLTVTIQDENDVAPTFTSNATIYLADDTPSGNAVIHTVTTDDPDITGTVTYTITDGNTNDDFSISTNGSITLNNALNASITPTYSLTVVADDTVNTTPFVLTVNVVTEPQLDIPAAGVELKEGSYTSAMVWTLSSTDVDGDTNPTYAIVEQSVNGTFELNGANTQLLTSATFDFENVASYTVTLQVTDSSSLQRFSTGILTISITDVNDELPTFTTDSVGLELREDTPIGLVDYIAVSDDPDSESADYSIIDGNTNDVFSIDTVSGNLSLEKQLNSFTDLSYTLTVQANDSINVGTQNVNVTVVTEPVFAFPASVEIAENTDTSGEYTVLVLNSTDRDGDLSPTYELISQSEPGIFELNADSTTLITTANFDYEDKNSYNVTLRVTDTSTFLMSTTATLNISITDTNDNAPVFQSNDTFELSEFTSTGTVVYVASTTDVDTGSVVAYSFKDGNTDNTFSINETSGEIQLAAVLQPDVTLMYNLVLTATDTLQATEFNVTVNVKTAPEFVLPSTNLTISEDENTSNTYTVWTISSTDADGDTGVMYEIVSQSVNGTFEISADNTNLTTNAPLDFETTQMYTVTLRATDNSAFMLSSTAELSVYITDANDNPPEFTSEGTLDLPEFQENGTVVYRAESTDNDTVGTVSYSFTDGNSDGVFSIDSASGNVTIIKALDPDTNLNYNLTIQANDGANLVTMDLTVNVITVPALTALQINITENNDAVAYQVWNLISTDKDGDTNAVYTLVNQSDPGVFAINNAKTAVVTNTSFDYEMKTQYTFKIEVTDSSSLQLSSTAEFNVSVIDENDVAPNFTSSAAVDVLENTAINTTVYRAETEDPDTIGTVTYSIIGLNDGNFLIDSESGNVTLEKALDATVKLTHTLQLQASDSVNVAKYNVTLNVRTAPFMNIPDTVTVLENVAEGSLVLALNSTDIDGDDNPVYELVAQSVPGTFKINDDNTNLVTNASIDYESNENFTVTVRVTEMSDLNLTSTAEFTVYVVDGNDKSPVFTSVNSTVVAENTAIGDSFYTAEATDEDTMGTISFSIIDASPNNVFNIDPDNGSLSLQSALSPSTVDDLTYSVMIQANDSSNTAMLNLTVHVKTVPIVHVTDIYIPEDVNTTETYTVWAINSTDLDGDENATFAIVSQSEPDAFALVNNEIVTSETFDFEMTKNYTVVINVTDTSTFKLSSSATLTVYITDVNDNAPIFTSDTSLVVFETAKTGEVLYNATTEDEDTVGNITYTISAGNRNSDFAIGSTSGELSLQNQLAPKTEADLVYNLTLEADDSANKAYLNVTVNVKTVPILEVIDVDITENTNTSGPYELWNITWSDLDGDQNPTIEIAVQSVPGTFEIIDNSVLVTSAEFDYENTTEYTVTMRITDVDGLMSNDTLTLYLNDENDVTPVFVSDSTLDISENTAVGADVYRANTTDPDTNPSIQYSISDGDADGFFSIEPAVGTLTLEKAFNPTTSLQYNLTLLANDTANVGELILTVNVITVPVINAYQINITENNVPGIVWNLTSSDRDGDVDPAYVIVNQSDAGIFEIDDANTSVITNTSFDFESQKMYKFEVEVTDGSSLKLSSTATFTVSVIDENDVTPAFTSSDRVQLEEDTAINTVVYTANATDEDTVGSISYSIKDGDDNTFAIDEVSGDITLVTALNASATLTHLLTLQANDTMNVATFNVTVTLSTAPVMLLPDEVTVVEGVDIGADVLTLNSTDLDGDTDPVYEIVDQSVPGTFKLNDNNTKLVTNVSIDYEAMKTFNLTVKVTDTSDFAKSSTSEFTVSVVDANDVTPVFTSANATTIPETTDIGSVIYTAATEDVDTVGTVAYSIIDGDPNSVFNINADNGSVTLQSALTSTTVDNVTYNLVLQANDSVNAATYNVTVNIKTAPVVHAVDIFVREDVNTTGTYTVWAINSTDADGDEDTSFSIISQSNPGTFEISGDEIVTNAAFDFEQTQSYTLVINATDSSMFKLSSTVTVTVFITDVNDVPPTFTSNTYLTILQTTETGTVLYNATSEDTDTVGNVTYAITDGNRNDDFSIEPYTGKLTLQNSLNPQTEADITYTLVLEANDTENAVYLNLTVDVKTVPYLNITDQEVTENTDTSGPLDVWTIEWTDLDGDVNHTFNIVNQSIPGTFDITENGVLVTSVTLDYEMVKNYTATISITDGQGLSSADTFTLTVLDQNDNTPVFTSNNTLDMSEETEMGEIVYTVLTTDPDTVGTIEYSTLDVTFNLNASTGDLSLAHTLDFRPSFNVTIMVNDSVNVATFNLTVNVKTRPAINFTGLNVEVSEGEDTSNFYTVLNLTSTDQDGDPDPQYDIISQSVPGTFVINGDKLQTNSSFDYELTQSYSVNIRVTDSSLGLTANDNLTVSVTDVNDNAPNIVSLTTLELREDTPTGTLVYILQAEDNDTVGNLSFSITDGNTNGAFGLDAESGNLTLETALNGSVEISYNLGLEASDGTLNDTITLVVSVKTAPVLVFPGSNITVAEGNYTSLNFSVLTLNSTDLDYDPNPRYELVSQSVPGTFFLSEDNTQLLTSAVFNYTALDMYGVTLRVTDSSDFNMTSSRNLSVYVTDENNVPPIFTSPTTLVLPETQATGAVVYTAMAVDIDLDGFITYTILSGNTNNDFELDPVSGNLTLANTLSPSAQLQYLLEVQANDTINTATLDLTVDVKSIPAITGENLTIVETTDTSGTYVVSELTSTDLDNDTDPEYTIVSQSVDNTFNITNGTLLTTTANFDHETRNSYEIVVQVTDTSEFALSSSATYTVSILDANDEAPVFTSDTEIYVPEDETPGGVVYTAVTYDNDTSENITYSIIGGNTNDDFNIDAKTGVVTLSNELRPREILEYTLQLQASDSINNGYLNLTVIVATIPQLLFPAAPETIVENTDTSSGIVVWICARQDLDGNTDPVYAVESQSVNNTFKLNDDNTKLITTANFDYEDTKSYEIVISVTDTSPLELSSTATLTVLVEDANDVAPNFTSPDSTKILDNTDPGTVVYTAETEDPDTIGTVTYKLTDGNTNNDFSIDATSGNITVVNNLNVTEIANYSLGIQANDTKNVASLTLLVELKPDIDECASNQCENNATCFDGIDEYTCECVPGFNGTMCENDIDECEPGPCLNGANCTQGINEYNCTCADGFSGVNCEINDECLSSPCINGACRDLVDGYNCTCVPGFEGVNCEININECASSPCEHNGTCVDGIDGYQCTCADGYDGDNCEKECEDKTFGTNCSQKCACFENGTTSCDHVDGTCNCNALFSGDRCETDIDECLNTSLCNKTNEGCDNNLNGGYNCSCLSGYERNTTDDNCDPVTVVVTTTPIPETKVKVSVTLVFAINIAATVDFRVTATFDRYAKAMEIELRPRYSRKFGVGVVFSLFFRAFRKGSLEVDYDVVVDKNNTLEVAQANVDIATSRENFTIFGEKALPSKMVVNNNPVPVGEQATDALLCQSYEAAVGKCTGDFACDVVDGTPGCRLKDTDDNLQLILGLGIGIPSFFVALAVIVLCVAYYNNKNKFLRNKHREYSDDRSNEVYERKIAVRANTGPPTWPFIASPEHPEYPQYPQYPEYSRDASQRYLPSEDFHGQYDNHGAQDRDSNNYSWDYLATHLRPGEPYHIRRPKLDYK